MSAVLATLFNSWKQHLHTPSTSYSTAERENRLSRSYVYREIHQ